MEKDNIEKKLRLYSIYDKGTETYGLLVMGYDDQETIKYYTDNFNSILENLDKYYTGEKLETERNNFIDKIHDSCIYVNGYFNEFTGEFVNDKNIIVDLFDFKFKDKN